MKEDNALSRLVRPSILIWLTFLFSVAMITDGNFLSITIKEVYVTVLETILVVAYTAYFIPKSFERISRINKKDKNVQSDTE